VSLIPFLDQVSIPEGVIAKTMPNIPSTYFAKFKQNLIKYGKVLCKNFRAEFFSAFGL